ncbi:hypothetical protein JTE90_027273 [Oedothorax gibbosus]|uniref:Uncharacterized protein n=1 Tax=Oedothorax gibbosus TaxID=931172 RepID=A0AAV6W3E7_9ARAC|nr:hypothetical protein JTE90_027273 [Oedothorax gibbosus]
MSKKEKKTPFLFLVIHRTPYGTNRTTKDPDNPERSHSFFEKSGQESFPYRLHPVSGGHCCQPSGHATAIIEGPEATAVS